MTRAFQIVYGEWLLLLDGELVNASFNSKGAAEAAIPVERARREAKRLRQDHGYFVRLDVTSPSPNVLWLGPKADWVHDLGGAKAFYMKKPAEDLGYIAKNKAKLVGTITVVRL